MLTLKITRDGAVRPDIPSLDDTKVEEWRNNGQLYGYKQILEGAYHLYLTDLASYWFSHRANEVIAFPSRGVHDHVLFDVYHRAVLPLAVQALQPEYEILHASAILSPKGVVGFCGFGHTGKSTLAYAMTKRNFRLWADDTIALEVHGPNIAAVPLSAPRIRLREPSIEFFGADEREAVAHGGEEGSLPIEPCPVSLAALCILKRSSEFETGAVVKVRRLFSSEAFRAVLDHSVCFSLNEVDRKRRMMKNYLTVADRVPILEICFQPGLENLGTIIDTIQREIDLLVTD